MHYRNLPDTFNEFADIDKILTIAHENIVDEGRLVSHADANKHL